MEEQEAVKTELKGNKLVLQLLRIRKHLSGDESGQSPARTIFNAEIPLYIHTVPGMFAYIDPRFPSSIRFVNVDEVVEIGMDSNRPYTDFDSLASIMRDIREVHTRWIPR